MNKVVLYLCYLFVFLLPIEDFFLQDLIGSSTRIAAGVLIFYYYYSGYRIELKYMPNYIYIYMLIVISSILFWSNTPDYYAIIRVFLWVLSAGLMANLTMKKPDLTSKLFTIYTITCLYLVYVAITTFINSDDPERVNVEDINDNILGMHFLNASLFCFYSLFAKNQKRYMKVILVFGLLLFIGSLITTGSRSGMLALGIGMLIIIPKSLNRIGSLLFFLVLSIGLIISIGENNIFIKFAGDRFQQAQDDKGAGRIVIWKVGMAMIEKNPILGVGFRNFPTEFKNYIDYARLEIDETNKLGDRDYAGAHNNVVEILAELGIFGLLSFYILQIVVFIRLYKIFDTVPISKLLFASLFALNFNGLFSDLTNLKIYWTILGLSCGLSYYGLMLIKKNRILPNETINPNIITT